MQKICHSGSEAEGDFLVSNQHSDFSDGSNRKLWMAVAERVETGSMPPAEKRRPPAAELSLLLDWISSYLLESYLRAAERALDAAIAAWPEPHTRSRRFDIKRERTVKPSGSVYRHIEDGVAIFSSWGSANIQVTL